jgi:PQQ-dependent dehydrogenase (methanol/ethanol family)
MDPRTPLLATLLIAASAGCVGRDLHRGSGTSRPVTHERLRAAPTTQEGWLSYGRDWSNRRYVPLTEINRHTVTGLQKLWQYDPGIMFRRSIHNESTPIVVDDLLIYTDLKDLVIAIDVRTGTERWRYQPDLGATALCCGVVNRGVAVYGDRVYLATLDARVIALDRQTGKVAWDVRAAAPAEGYSFTMAPLAADGKIIVGASGGEFGIRGFVDAYDPATGARLWRFWTVPSPEEGGWYGHWSRTTPDGEVLPRDIAQEKRDSARYAEAWRKGGASVYSTPAYDPDLRMLYVATGNPSPVDGGIPPGDNLYSTSLLALDIGTGALKWYYQMLPHNVWDFDAASPPVLFDLPAGDSTVPGVGEAGKTGWVYLLDRRTGRQIRRSDAFVPLENIFPTPTPQGTRSSPGTSGGANWPPPAYSPRTGLMYVLGSHQPMLYVLDSTAKEKKNGEVFKYAHFSKLPVSLNFGTFSAIDIGTGKIRWQRRAPVHLMFGGAVVTEGGVVFYGDIEGYLNGLDAETGETVWRDRAAKGYLGPPISFQVDGHQRLAIASRRGITVYGLPGSPRSP